jgi:hypothetical protein
MLLWDEFKYMLISNVANAQCSAHICTPSFSAFKPLVDHFLLAIKKKAIFIVAL